MGETLGKYHPHGDQSVYDALVRLAQDFSMQVPLVSISRTAYITHACHTLLTCELCSTHMHFQVCNYCFDCVFQNGPLEIGVWEVYAQSPCHLKVFTCLSPIVHPRILNIAALLHQHQDARTCQCSGHSASLLRVLAEPANKSCMDGNIQAQEKRLLPLRSCPLQIDGHGNFGSVDSDPPAAMRYTECRLQHFSSATFLSDLDSDTVNFIPNFDASQVGLCTAVLVYSTVCLLKHGKLVCFCQVHALRLYVQLADVLRALLSATNFSHAA